MKVNKTDAPKNTAPGKYFELKFWLVFAALVIAAGGGYFLAVEKPKIERLEKLVQGEIIKCAELTVLKYNYTELVKTTKSAKVLGMKVGSSFNLWEIEGTIRAGIKDISKITFKINPVLDTITVKIPDAEILSNEISAEKQLDEYGHIFVEKITDAEMMAERDRARSEVEAHIVSEGFLREGRERTRTLLFNLLAGCNFKKIVVE